jgi:hypothetical protein
MGKPVSLIVKEAEDKIYDTINSLELHPTILEFIMKDVYNNVRANANQQYNLELESYQQSLQNEEKDDEKDMSK